mgnify:CR=1 FL=1
MGATLKRTQNGIGPKKDPKMGLALKGTPKWERPHPPKKWDPKNGRDPKKDPKMGATLKRTPKWDRP